MNRSLRSAPAPATGTASAFSRAFDVAVTTVVFGFLGWFVDRWLGTAPIFLIVVSILAVVGQFVRLGYQYTAEMRQHERALHGGTAADHVTDADTPPPADRVGP